MLPHNEWLDQCTVLFLKLTKFHPYLAPFPKELSFTGRGIEKGNKMKAAPATCGRLSAAPYAAKEACYKGHSAACSAYVKHPEQVNPDREQNGREKGWKVDVTVTAQGNGDVLERGDTAELD